MLAPWQLVVSALVVLVVSSLITILVQILQRSWQNSRAFPRGPWAWPILGHLPLLIAGCPHHTLAELSRKPGYGPILGLRLGSKPTVVACSAAMAKELLRTHDKAFANRPNYQLVDALLYGYDNAVTFSSYSRHWIKLRKIYTLELLTAKRLQELQHVRQDSICGLLQSLHEASAGGTRAIQLSEFFGEMSSHMVSRLLQSKTLSEAGGDSLPKLIRDVEHELAPTLGDFIPWLKCLDFLRLRSMKDIHARLDNVIDAILTERRQAMKSSQPNELPQDFLQVLLSKEATSDDPEELLTTEQIKGSMLDILGASTHTTTLTLEWAMAELLRNPSCLCKLQHEIDAVMGMKGEDLVKDEHLSELPYLESTVKEVLRLHPVVPLLLPRISSIEVKVDKYTLPAHTQVMVNAWAIGRDPQVWENAEKFLPERFEGKEIDLKGQHFDLIPFGAGRRICPGLRLGLSIVLVTLANLVKTFNWHLPHGQSPMSIDMSEKRGIASCKATPLLVIPTLRNNS